MITKFTENEFLDTLARIARSHDRAACAQLRRSLSYEPGEDTSIHRHLGHIASGLGDAEQRAVYVVGGWYGLWRSKISGDTWAFDRYGGLTLGRALRRVMARGNNAVKQSEERRVARLLNLDSTGMETLVPQMIARIASVRGLHLDWGLLLRDVAQWGEGSSWVPPEAPPGWVHPSRRWAQDFWSSSPITEKPNNVFTPSLEEQNGKVA